MKARRLLHLLFTATCLFPVGFAKAQITCATLVSFNGTNGSEPQASLIQGNDGALYGTTLAGGENTTYVTTSASLGYGTVFRITPDGQFRSLASFNGTNGINPRGPLIEGDSGVFYGMTWLGGISNYGTIFQITSNGTLTTLVSFIGTNGAWPQSGLTRGGDGWFYGTTRLGGTGSNAGFQVPGSGTVFKVDTNGVLVTLHSFDLATDGAQPFAPLVLASDGNFYGTTLDGGLGYGTVFKMTPDGTVTTLAQFDVNNTGIAPYGGLVQIDSGSLYGLAINPGLTEDYIISASPDGTISNVVRIPSESVDFAGLIEASDGNLYGANSGYNPNGSIFRVGRDGSASDLFDFGGTNGSYPHAALLQASDGLFYSTTSGGGSFGLGTVFCLSVPSAECPMLHNLKASGTNITFSWGTLLQRKYQLQYASDITTNDWVNLGKPFIATNSPALFTDALSNAPQRFYRVVLLP